MWCPQCIAIFAKKVTALHPSLKVLLLTGGLASGTFFAEVWGLLQSHIVTGIVVGIGMIVAWWIRRTHAFTAKVPLLERDIVGLQVEVREARKEGRENHAANLLAHEAILQELKNHTEKEYERYDRLTDHILDVKSSLMERSNNQGTGTRKPRNDRRRIK